MVSLKSKVFIDIVLKGKKQSKSSMPTVNDDARMKLKQKHFKSWEVKLGLLLIRPTDDELAEVVFQIDSGIAKLSEPL